MKLSRLLVTVSLCALVCACGSKGSDPSDQPGATQVGAPRSSQSQPRQSEEIESARNQILGMVSQWKGDTLNSVHRHADTLRDLVSDKGEINRLEADLVIAIDKASQKLTDDIRGYQASSRRDLIDHAEGAISRASSEIESELDRLEAKYR